MRMCRRNRRGERYREYLQSWVLYRACCTEGRSRQAWRTLIGRLRTAGAAGTTVKAVVAVVAVFVVVFVAVSAIEPVTEAESMNSAFGQVWKWLDKKETRRTLPRNPAGRTRRRPGALFLVVVGTDVGLTDSYNRITATFGVQCDVAAAFPTQFQTMMPGLRLGALDGLLFEELLYSNLFGKSGFGLKIAS